MALVADYSVASYSTYLAANGYFPLWVFIFLLAPTNAESVV